MTSRVTALFYPLIALSMFLWGASWISAKAIVMVPASVAAFWRFLLMFLSFLPVLALQGKPYKVDKKGLLYTVLAAAALAVYNLMFFWGLHSGYAGKHGVLTTTLNPLFTFLWAALFGLRHGDRLAWFGLCLGFLGGAIQMLGDQLSWASFTDPTGLIFAGSAAVYALLTVFGQLAQRSLHLFVFSTILYGLSAVALLPLAAAEGALDVAALPAVFWPNILFIALLVGTFATTVYFYAAQRIGAARASSFTFTIPVTVVALSWVFFGEVPQITSLVGGALSLVAVTLIQREPKGLSPTS